MNKRIAIISPDVMGPIHNGGVGTSCALLAELLAKSGYDVKLVFAAEPYLDENTIRKWTTYYKKKKISFNVLPQFEFELQHGDPWVRISYNVFEYLKTQALDLVIFPDMYGVGYFSQLARRNGTHFQDTQFLVSFLGPILWSREDNLQLLSHQTDLSIPMLERGSIEWADCLQIATPWSAEWLKSHDWKCQSTEQILFPFERVSRPLPRPKIKPKEFVFFGRLEPRKGLLEFLTAMETLEEAGRLKGRKITFLGRPGPTMGMNGEKFIEAWMARTGIKAKLITNRQSFEAVAYLRKKKALAVIASWSETMGYTLVECLSHGIPFICSDIEPFRNILGAGPMPGMFESKNASGLAETLLREEYIWNPSRAEELAELTASKWLNLVKKMVRPKPIEPRRETPSSISVLITHFDRDQLLREALDSLIMQTDRPNEVLVFDDASRTTDLKKLNSEYFGKFQKVGVHFDIIHGSFNRGPAHGRNVLAQRAKGEFLIFMDDDNLALPDEISTLKKIQRFTDADVITVAMQKFFHGQKGLWRQRRWTPVGFDISASVFFNAMGDTNLLIRKTLFDSLEGFSEDRTLRAEDLHLLMRAARAGAKMTLSPDPLFEYRIHKNNRSLAMNFHQSRLINMKNTLSVDGHDMSALAHLILAWSYEKKINWLEEPPPGLVLFRKKRPTSYDLTRQLPKIMKNVKAERAVRGFQFKFNRDKILSLDMSKARQFDALKKHYLFLAIFSKRPGTVKPSNGFQQLSFKKGLTWITVGLENDASRLHFATVSTSIIIAKAMLVPIETQ